jgi:beta-lactamase family protein
VTTRILQGALAMVAAATLLAAPANAAGTPTITATAARSEIQFEKTTTISGTYTIDGTTPAAGQVVTLEVDPYPYKGWSPADTTTTNTAGAYTFTIKGDRNSRYRVTGATPLAQSAEVPITVDERLDLKLHYVHPGKVSVEVASRHPSDIDWGHKRIYWFVAEDRSKEFHYVTKSTSHQGHHGLTRARATFPIADAGRYRFYECIKVSDAGAMGPSSAHRKCTKDDFRRSYKSIYKPQLTITAFQAKDYAPAGFPFPSRVRSAASYLSQRAGYTAFAVVDSQGRLSGQNIHRTFVSASVVKAMLLVAYLRELDAHHQPLDSNSRSYLYPMIHVSDNSAATEIWRRVGDGRLYSLAHAAHMTDFSIVGIWANAQISAADQARFFWEINDLLPDQFRSYARSLLAHIVDYESWGIPHVARPHWRVLFKGGWRSTGRGQLVHQVARLEHGKSETFAMAVMTDGDPSMGYGITTIEGVTARLVGHHALRASTVQWPGPGGG